MSLITFPRALLTVDEAVTVVNVGVGVLIAACGGKDILR